MEFPGSHNRWWVAYNHPIGNIYKWYISGIHCQLMVIILSPTTYQGNQKQPLKTYPTKSVGIFSFKLSTDRVALAGSDKVVTLESTSVLGGIFENMTFSFQAFRSREMI